MSKALIVDDNAEDVCRLEALLIGSGYEVVTAVNGAEALEKARDDRPALIVTDVLMPVMNGYSLCRNWKADERLKEVPFVFYAADFTDPKDEQFGLSLGAERVVVKPAEPDVFLEIIRDVLAEHRSGIREVEDIPAVDEMDHLKQYNERLNHHLEAKILQLDEANREIAHLVSEHERAIDAHQESRRELSTLMSNLPGMAYRCLNDADWTMRFLSQGAQMLTGYDPGQLIDNNERSYGDLILPDDRKAVWNEVQEAVTAGRPFTMSYRIVTKGGEEKWVWEQGRQVAQLETGTAVLEGFITDVTVQRQAEEAVRKSEQKYAQQLAELEHVYTTSPVGLCLLSTDLRYVRVNARLAEMNGKPASEHIGKTPGEIIPEIALEAESVFRRVIETGEPALNFETRGTTPAQPNVERDWLVNYHPVKSSSGVVIGVGAVVEDITERKQAEDALRAEKGFADSILDSVVDTIILFDPETGMPLRWNRAGREVTGFSDEQIAARKVPDDWLSTEDSQKAQEAIVRLQQGERPAAEVSLVTKDGQSVPVEFMASILNDPAGQPRYVLAVGRDLTDRREMEDSIRESERSLNDAQKMARVGSWNWDIGTGQVKWSRETYRIFRLDPKTFRPDIDSVMNRFHPDDRKTHETLIAHALAKREHYNFEARIQLPDGSIRDVISTSRGHYDSQGSLTQLSGTVQDVTELKQNEESLRQRVQQLAALNSVSRRVSSRLDLGQVVRLTLEGIVEQLATDVAFLFLHKDGEFGLAGVSPDLPESAASAHFIADCMCKMAVSQRQPYYSHDVSSDTRCTGEECMRAGFRSVATLPLMSGEEVFGVLGLSSKTVRDFSKEAAFLETLANEIAVGLHSAQLFEEVRRQTDELTDANEQIRRLNTELEKRVEQRTMELQVANEDLKAFAYSVSHDLRAPLRAMEGFSNALIEDYADRLDEEGREFIGHIADSAARMDALILDLLAYSKLGRSQLRLQPISLEAAVNEVVHHFGSDMNSCKGDVSAEGEFFPVRAHSPTVRQVLTNLVSNALKFVGSDVRPLVRICSESRGPTVRIWVEDNGIGIAEEHQERVFQVFERLHGIETYPGTGIGLAIVRLATEKMGGQCGVVSTPAREAVFG